MYSEPINFKEVWELVLLLFYYFERNKLNWETIKYLMLASFIGSIIGGVIVQFIDTELLSFVIPIVLVVIAIYFIISPKPKVRTKNSED